MAINKLPTHRSKKIQKSFSSKKNHRIRPLRSNKSKTHRSSFQKFCSRIDVSNIFKKKRSRTKILPTRREKSFRMSSKKVNWAYKKHFGDIVDDDGSTPDGVEITEGKGRESAHLFVHYRRRYAHVHTQIQRTCSQR